MKVRTNIILPKILQIIHSLPSFALATSEVTWIYIYWLCTL